MPLFNIRGIKQIFILPTRYGGEELEENLSLSKFSVNQYFTKFNICMAQNVHNQSCSSRAGNVFKISKLL